MITVQAKDSTDLWGQLRFMFPKSYFRSPNTAKITENNDEVVIYIPGRYKNKNILLLFEED